MVGTDDIRLTGSFKVTADRIIPGKIRKSYILGLAYQQR